MQVIILLPDGNEASVAKLGSGTSFGELALLGSGLRNATIKAVEDSMFMTINRRDYTNILKQEHARELRAKVDTLQR